jgi:hypothetical protein
MLVITKYTQVGDVAILRDLWEQMGAKEAQTELAAKWYESQGELAFVDETIGGERCISEEERAKIFDYSRLGEWPVTYRYEYVEPHLPHMCVSVRAWHEIRFVVAKNAYSIHDAYSDGPYWARVCKSGVGNTLIREILPKYDPILECTCEWYAKMLAIKRLLGLDPIAQDSIESRVQIDSRYADLQQLLGLNPRRPELPTIWL